VAGTLRLGVSGVGRGRRLRRLWRGLLGGGLQFGEQEGLVGIELLRLGTIETLQQVIEALL